MEQRELEYSACYLRTKCKILNKQATNLRKSVEKLYQDLCEILRGAYGRTDGASDKEDSRFLAEV